MSEEVEEEKVGLFGWVKSFLPKPDKSDEDINNAKRLQIGEEMCEKIVGRLMDNVKFPLMARPFAGKIKTYIGMAIGILAPEICLRYGGCKPKHVFIADCMRYYGVSSILGNLSFEVFIKRFLDGVTDKDLKKAGFYE